jgi:quercetin dioxygenase-like cupin family protein
MADSDCPQQPPGSDRKREHPDVRFAAAQHSFDLHAVVRELLAEPATSVRGHRQKTLYRHGRLTVALFAFDGGGSLPPHTAAGAVTINVLQGRLRVRTPDEEHDLPAGNLLVLAPGVQHDVAAPGPAAGEPSVMLLQVHLDPPPAARE